ncbi:MAG: hypothetical protein R3E97_25040 [Candidatus Eisenbacteria bacterium]
MRALSLLVCLSIVLQGAPGLADFEGRANAPGARPVDPAPSSRLSHAWPPLGSIYQVAQLEGDGTSATDLDRRIAELEAKQGAISTKPAKIGMITGGAVAGIGASVALVCWIINSQSGINCSGDGAAVGDPSMTGISLIVMMSGIGLAGLSGLLYVHQEKRRDELGREILDLRRSRDAATASMPDVHFDVAGGRGLRLDWRF